MPATARGGIVFTDDTGLFNITFTLNLTNPDSIPANTDETPNLISITFSGTNTPPPTDEGGFPVGTGTGYVTFTLNTLQIGTNSSGQITSWTIDDSLFASYPAFAGENPTDFFCDYDLNSTAAGDAQTLTVDNDAGFCPPTTTGAAGTFETSLSSGAPEPDSFLPLAAGIAAVLALAIGRRRARHA